MARAMAGLARGVRVVGYRSDPSQQQRFRRLVKARRRELQRLSPVIEQVYARRLARLYGAAFGLAAFFAALVMLGADWLLYDKPRPAVVSLMMATWPLGLFVYWMTRSNARGWFLAELYGWINERTYLERDMARLQEESIPQRARAMVASLQVKSLAMPLVMMSLALPLTMHLPVALLGGHSLRQFAAWMSASVLIVGHAHVVLAVLSYRAVKKMCREHVEPNGWRVLMYTVIASAIPGALLLLVPPVLTAVTGLLFVPAMFSWVKRAHEREQALLA